MCRSRFQWISVDEFQDVDEQQYRLLTLLAPSDGNLCVIGDPNQAIYGFRGADASCFDRFRHDYPAASTVRLTRNYRSTGTIVAASAQVIASRANAPIAEMVRDMHERIAIQTAPTERAEAEAVIKTIEQHGGWPQLLLDRQRPGNARRRRTTGRSPISPCSTAPMPRAERCARPSIAPGIPYQKSSHTPLMELPAVRALLQELGDGSEDTMLPDALRAAAERLAERDDAISGGDDGHRAPAPHRPRGLVRQ